jgi:ubiquinone/menaquinone biosynthesis C-methylase UbiE
VIETLIDWNEIWKEQMARHNEMSNGMDCASYWDDEVEAKYYWEMVKEKRDLIEGMVQMMGISSTSRVLDIGAGPGTLAIPLSKKVAYVTAVEPSGAMFNVLRKNIEENGLDNIDCVQKRWEEVDVESDLDSPYDLIVASFSLGMTDIKAAIQKMMKVSSGRVYLAWFAGEPSWEKHSRELSTLLYGKNLSQPVPRSDVLFNVLCQMGIFPNVMVFPFELSRRFSSFEEAVDYFANQLRAKTDDQRSALGEALSQILEENEGSSVLKISSINMMIWWQNNLQRVLESGWTQTGGI